MNNPAQEGENNISSKNIHFPYYPKQKSKKFFPITPQNNLKNFFPEDFFSNSSNNPQFENVNISFKKMNSDEIGKNQTEKIINNLNQTKENNIIHIISYKIDSSTNSHSTINTENENINSKDKNYEFENNDILTETPHFFPQVEKKEKILSNNIKIQNNLINPINGKKVNNEIKNLFNNIPDNLKRDPDVNEKVGILLKNIYEMKQIIKDKKEKKIRPISERNKNKQNNNLIAYQPNIQNKKNIKNININSRYVKM